MAQRVILSVCTGLLVCVIGAGSFATTDEADIQLLQDNKLPSDGPGLLEFFRQRTVGAGDMEQIKALIRQLGDDSYQVREEASRRLVSLGGRGKVPLHEASNDPDVEVRIRVRECLRQIEQGEGTAVIAAAVRVLTRHRPEGAAGVLLEYLPAAEDETVAVQIRESLAHLAAADPRTVSLLEATLKDRIASKRAAAAVALFRANPRGQQPVVRKLLQDPEAMVRARIALELAAARDKETIPVLIDLLEPSPVPETRVVPEILYRLAGDKAPPYPAKPSEAELRKYREDWKAWWRDHKDKVDAARLEEVVKTAGHTLVLLLDAGKAIYLDAANRPLWELDNLRFPLDAQMLPGDRLLVAEHQGGRVTERNHKNEIVWEKKIEGPILAQRLPNGNTFMATREQLLEYDANGEEVYRHIRPNGDQIMKAHKLPNGDYACVTQRRDLTITRYVRLDAKGKELKNIPVNLHYAGGRIHVRPNGNVLIPETNNNRIVELDSNGSIVWEAVFDQPVAALRLPSGHTLVTSMNPRRGAVELDRAGKDVWQYKADTRVTRAFRHE